MEPVSWMEDIIPPQTPPPEPVASTTSKFENPLNSIIINPLQMDEILENVFRYCALKDLYSCRQVSKTWHRVSLPTWLEKSPPVLLHNAWFITRSKTERACRLKTFMETFHLYLLEEDPELEDPNSSYYEHYGIRRFRKFNFYFHECIEVNLVKSFWRGCGTWVTHLNMGPHTYPITLFRDILSCKHTPNLVNLHGHFMISWKLAQEAAKKLDYEDGFNPQVNLRLKLVKITIDLHDDYIMNDNNLKYLPVNWTQILSCYPNLENLSLRFMDNYSHELNRMLEAVTEIRRKTDKTEKSKKLPLKSLNIRLRDFTKEIGEFPEAAVSLLQDTELHLKSFTFSFKMGTPPPLVYDVLDAQKESLTSLEFFRSKPLQDFSFPVMSSLQDITLVGRPFPNLNWLGNLPNLKSLKLVKKRGRDQSRAGYEAMIWASVVDKKMEEVVFPSMTTFDCDYYCNWRESDIRKFRQWMPNLQNLRLDIGSGIFHVVCECWPTLEHLHVYGDHLDDVGVTGMEVIAEEKDGKVVVQESDVIIQYPGSIADLRDLRSFTMETHGGYGSELVPKITTASIIYGLLDLPRLEKVELKVKGYSKGTQEKDRVLTALAEKIGSVEEIYFI